MSDEIGKALEDQTLQMLDRVGKQLADAEAHHRKKIKELHFVTVFLPFFAGDAYNPSGADLEAWMRFSGGPFAKVDVIDDKDVVLFTVPPIMNSDAIKPATYGDDERFSLDAMMNTATAAAQAGRPKQAQESLVLTFKKQFEKMKSFPHYKKYLDAWNAIFARYGRPLIIVQSEKEANTNQPSSGTLNYESEDF